MKVGELMLILEKQGLTRKFLGNHCGAEPGNRPKVFYFSIYLQAITGLIGAGGSMADREGPHIWSNDLDKPRPAVSIGAKI